MNKLHVPDLLLRSHSFERFPIRGVINISPCVAPGIVCLCQLPKVVSVCMEAKSLIKLAGNSEAVDCDGNILTGLVVDI